MPVLPEEAFRADAAAWARAVWAACPPLGVMLSRLAVHHAAVATAYGAGLGSAVVVDVGHASASVTAVDEGAVVGGSRVKLGGGAPPRPLRP